MAEAELYVQIDGEHHRVKSFTDHPAEPAGAKRTSLEFSREYKLGCGKTVTDRADRMSEATTEPGGDRHIAKGCFAATKSDRS